MELLYFRLNVSYIVYNFVSIGMHPRESRLNKPELQRNYFCINSLTELTVAQMAIHLQRVDDHKTSNYFTTYQQESR